jgi:hypothetical protein
MVISWQVCSKLALSLEASSSSGHRCVVCEIWKQSHPIKEVLIT